MSVSIMLVDDHRLFIDGLISIIEQISDIDVAATATSGREAVRIASANCPDIILMDISMPDLNGIEATRQILSRCPDTKIVMLSMHSDRRFVIESFKAGAIGFLLKESASDELLKSLEAIIAGEVYLSSKIAGVVISDLVNRQSKEPDSAYSLLSAREREVLQLIAEGFGTKEIAATLNVSIKTIESHRKQIMDKLDIRSIAELTKYAIREGLTDLK